MRSLKIAMLGHKRIPSREGGIEVAVEEICTRMVQRGHKVTCFNRGGHHVSGKEFDSVRRKCYKGIVLKTVPTLDKRGWAAVTSSASGAILAALGDFDVVHFHAEGPCFMLWLPKLTGKRCIATIHGLDHKRAKWGRFARTYIMMGERAAVRWADEIIVLSRGAQEYFLSKYKRRTVLIPNGVVRPEKRKGDALIERTYGIKKDSYFCFLSRLTPEKGVHYLIRAFQKLHTDKKLVIAGGASDTDQYVSMLKRLASGNPNIIFTGFVSGAILEEIYSNAYAYILPSDLEGMPLSLLEAMSYGNCVLGSNISEIRDVIGSHGVLFQKGSVRDLAEKMQMLVDHPQLVEQYRSDVSDYICGKYSWDSVVEQTLRLYQDRRRGS